MKELEIQLAQLNNTLRKLSEHKALFNNGRYAVTYVTPNNTVNDQEDNNVKNSDTDSNSFQYAKNIEPDPVEPDTIEEVEPDTIEEVEPDTTEQVEPQEEVEPDTIEEVEPEEEVEPIGPTESSEVYTYKREAILVSEDYTATMDDYYIGVKSKGSVVITIPCDCDDGHEIVVKSEMKKSLNNRKITITSMDDENLCSIDGELEYIMDLPYQSVRLICRDSSWWTI